MAGIKDLSEDEAICGKKDYLFLFPARQSLLEVFAVIIITGLYGALMTYFIHSITLVNLQGNTTYSSLYYGLTIATVVLSSYSLFSQPIPESTPYLTNDSFSILSSHYQRVGYSLIIAGSVCIAEFSLKNVGTLGKF